MRIPERQLLCACQAMAVREAGESLLTWRIVLYCIVQVLEAALDAMPDSKWPKDCSGSARLHNGGPTKDGSSSEERVCMELKAVFARAEESATAAAEAMETDEALPDVWELTYRAALALARGAAVDELLGNAAASMRSYAKVKTC